MAEGFSASLYNSGTVWIALATLSASLFIPFVILTQPFICNNFILPDSSQKSMFRRKYGTFIMYKQKK